MIKAIIFDCFGVLTDTKWNIFLVSLDQSVQSEVQYLHKSFDLGHIEYGYLADRIEELTGLSRNKIDDVFINRSSYHKNTELIELIKQLSKEYKTGVLSNVGTNWIRETLLTKDEAAAFNSFTLSYENKMAKPDPRMYQLACTSLGVEPSQVVFVDDNINYCKAAENIGMKAILYKDFIQFKHELEALLADSN